MTTLVLSRSMLLRGVMNVPSAKAVATTALSKQRCWNSSMEASADGNATTTASASPDTPTLKHVPSLPFLGSTVPQYSKIPAMDPSQTYDYWPEVTRQYGDFYTMGIPGIGAGITQTVYIVQDPQEMMKVLKAEGKFPSGAAQSAWALRQIMEDHGHAAAAKIFDQGPEWKRVRSFFQTDLLSPQAAKHYVPSIAEVTQYASQGVVHYR